MECRILRNRRCAEVYLFPRFELNIGIILVKVLLVLVLLEAALATTKDFRLQMKVPEKEENFISHTCIHDQIIEQTQKKLVAKCILCLHRSILNSMAPSSSKEEDGCCSEFLNCIMMINYIRICLNYDAVDHSSDRDWLNLLHALLSGCSLVSS